MPLLVIGQRKASVTRQRLRDWKLEVDLAGSFAYADSISDLPLLELVGHPTAVYADEQLAALAQERGWPALNDD